MKGFTPAAATLCLTMLMGASCSTMKSMKDKTVAGASKVGQATTSSVGSAASKVGGAASSFGSSTATASSKAYGSMKSAFAGLLPGPKVPIVKARHEDMREMQTGHDRALAYQTTKRRGGFFSSLFNGPVDFKEPNLPSSGEMDGSLLPPKAE